MPDRRDHRHATNRERADQRLLVERPQILEAAAAAADHQQVENRQLLRQAQHLDHFRRGAGALHLGGQHDDPPAPAAARENAQEILHGGARGRRDEADRCGHRGKRALALAIEQALGRQPLLERLEFPLQPPDAVLDHRADDELILSPRLVDADLAVHDHLQPVAQFHLLAQRIAAKQNRAELRARILQRKINMPARLRPEVRDLAAHPARPQAAFEQRLHASREFAHTLRARARRARAG
jgi:hypothetical protein